MKTNISRLIGPLLLILTVCGAVWGFYNRQYIYDQLVVWQYHPVAEVVTLTRNTTMTETGRFYFYASQPDVSDAAEFNQQCKQQERGSAILGCYTMARIYVYDVPNEELTGIEEVTAAHEMLHAAWDRLSDEEKTRVSGLLEKAYRNIESNELADRMRYYDRTEPGERWNELHSIIGTEFRRLDQELETYYRHYFANRQSVVDFHEQYQQVFYALEARAKALKSEIDLLADTLTDRIARYEVASRQVATQGAALDTEYRTLDRSDEQEVNSYNASVSAYNQAVASLKAEYQQIAAIINQHNQLVKAYNSVVTNQRNLQQSIDSTTITAPSKSL